MTNLILAAVTVDTLSVVLAGALIRAAWAVNHGAEAIRASVEGSRRLTEEIVALNATVCRYQEGPES